MKTILFQGDSITDCCRPRERGKEFPGQGYPLRIVGKMDYEHPGEYKFYNRGIGGNRLVDLYARIKVDIINLKPDIMSILVGVNDVWHEFEEYRNGVDADKYFMIYKKILLK